MPVISTAMGKSPGSWCLVLGAWCLVLGSWFLVLGSWCLVLGAWFLEGIDFKALNTKYQDTNSKN
ncbi:MAG TPA: hypothetical protein PLS70_03780, partial [Acidobacteriota bacterium]|nr:hypothetical protein [Acidobacteriota bacterium]